MVQKCVTDVTTYRGAEYVEWLKWVLGKTVGPAGPPLPPLIQNSSLLHHGGPTAPPPCKFCEGNSSQNWTDAVN